MLKKLILSISLVAFFLFTFPYFYFHTYSQQIQPTTKNVVYDLPYPGLLPDNPLYFLKATRDKILDFVTRDNLKKAQLYLTFSDKRVAMSPLLFKKGKDNLAVSTISKAEKYALKISPLLKQAKEQGGAVSPDFISKLKLSNEKHKEVIEDLYKNFPQGEQQSLQDVLELNQEVHQALGSL